LEHLGALGGAAAAARGGTMEMVELQVLYRATHGQAPRWPGSKDPENLRTKLLSLLGT
jgi:hypothetical protein